MKTIFDFTDLMTPGTWIFGTETFSAVSAIIRGAEEGERKHSLIEAAEAVVNPNIPSHTVLVRNVSAGGNINCSEMTWPYAPGTSNNGNNTFILTEEYGLNVLGNHICGVFRAPELDDSDELQAQSTQWMIDQHRRGMQYGILNLMADLGFCKMDGNKEVCIQYGIAYHIWLQVAIHALGLPQNWVLPSSWILSGNKPNVISLEEAMEWCTAQGWKKVYTKQVPDNYDPTKELLEDGTQV